MYSHWTKIYSTNNAFSAEFLKQGLIENGINAVVLNQQDSSYTAYGSIHVLVEEESAAAARAYMHQNNIS